MRVKRMISLLMAALGSVSNSMAAEGVKKGGKVSSSSALNTKRGAQRLKRQGGESKKGGANKQVNAVSKGEDKALNQSISGKKDVVWTKSEADISAKKEGWSTKRIVGTAVGSLGGTALIGAGVAAIVREICGRNKKSEFEKVKSLTNQETENENSEYTIDEKLKNENLNAFKKNVSVRHDTNIISINTISCLKPFKFCLSYDGNTSDDGNTVEQFMFEAIISDGDEKDKLRYDTKRLMDYYCVVDKDVWNFINSIYQSNNKYWKQFDTMGAKFSFRYFDCHEYNEVFSNWADNLVKELKCNDDKKKNFKERILGQLNLSSRAQQGAGNNKFAFGVGLEIRFSPNEWNYFMNQYKSKVYTCDCIVNNFD